MRASQARVVDASVAVKWYIPESGSDLAAALLASGMWLLAPDLVIPEVGNVLWKRVRQGELGVTDAREIMDAMVSSHPLTLHPSDLLLIGAFDIATSFDRPIYDALYLALAVAEDALLVTADSRLCNALQGTALEPFVVSLDHTRS